MRVFSFFVLMALAGISSANVRYTYTGATFTSITTSAFPATLEPRNPTLTAADRITGFIETAEPLGANGSFVLDSSNTVAFEFTDGTSTINDFTRIDAGQDFTVIVDYAHSPDAVERVIRSVHADGRRIVVLGCGGDRDRGKRSDMGRIAAECADILFVTDDNPRSEEPAGIRAAMLAGVTSENRSHVHEIGDRLAAISAALEAARPGDAVLILGKGHETGQEIAGIIHPFDDRVVARDLLAAEAS